MGVCGAGWRVARAVRVKHVCSKREKTTAAGLSAHDGHGPHYIHHGAHPKSKGIVLQYRIAFIPHARASSSHVSSTWPCAFAALARIQGQPPALAADKPHSLAACMSLKKHASPITLQYHVVKPSRLVVRFLVPPLAATAGRLADRCWKYT